MSFTKNNLINRICTGIFSAMIAACLFTSCPDDTEKEFSTNALSAKIAQAEAEKKNVVASADGDVPIINLWVSTEVMNNFNAAINKAKGVLDNHDSQIVLDSTADELDGAILEFRQAKKTSARKLTITLGMYKEVDNEGDLHDGYADKFKKSFPNITVNYVDFPYDGMEEFEKAVNKNIVPTIFDTYFTEPQEMIKKGYVKDITSMIKTMGYDTKMNPAVLELLSKGGKIYGIPRDSYAMGIYVNIDLFRKAGLVTDGVPLYPKTWAELVTISKTIKEKTGKPGFVLLANTDYNFAGWQFSNIAWSFGVEFVVQQSDSMNAQVNTPQALAALQYVRDLKWVHDIITDDPTNEGWVSGFEHIGKGSAAMYMGANDAVDQFVQYNLPLQDLALIPIPAGPNGRRHSLGGGTIYMFSADATDDQAAAAMLFLAVMGRVPEVQEDVIKGLRDRAQKRKNNGVPVIPDPPVWTDTAYLNAVQNIIDEFANVDMRLYKDYFDALTEPGYLKNEPPAAQALYAALSAAVKEVIENEHADLKSLLETAQNEYQSALNALD